MLLLVTVGAGLALTALAAASPGYWWFVAIFACGRPLLSATNALAQVTAAEQTASRDRARAVALIAAGYGAGAGAIAIVHSLAASTLGFRGVFVLALVPLALLPLARLRRNPQGRVVPVALYRAPMAVTLNQTLVIGASKDEGSKNAQPKLPRSQPCWNGSASRRSGTATRPSCRAASSSVSLSPGR